MIVSTERVADTRLWREVMSWLESLRKVSPPLSGSLAKVLEMTALVITSMEGESARKKAEFDEDAIVGGGGEVLMNG
jgi:hypothetical protein